MTRGLFRKFIQSIERIRASGYVIPSKIAIALSGGVDSIVLLSLLSKYKHEVDKSLDIHAITIDHGLRRESSEEAASLNRLVLDKHKYPITHTILKINQEINPNQVEKHARELRYQLLFEYCQRERIEHIFMGHHLDDQLETFVLRLLSNSTMFGLIGMKPVCASNLHGINKVDLIRPLLEIPKAEIYAYARNGLEWYEDNTNQDPTLTPRNRIRKYIADMDVRSKDELVQLHGKVCDVLDQVVYTRMKGIMDGTTGIMSVDVSLDLQLLLLSINIRIDKTYYESACMNDIDFLVLDRLLFNEVWKVSPVANYLYGFTRFDSKNSVVSGSNKSGKSISEMILEDTGGRRRRTTLAGCVFEWRSVVSGENDHSVHVCVYREPEHRHREVVTTIPSNTTTLFDNRVFVSLPRDVSLCNISSGAAPSPLGVHQYPVPAIFRVGTSILMRPVPFGVSITPKRPLEMW